MRVLQLDLIKFGAFTDATLDFSAAPRALPGLHLIYGPNEAGKSTARRALRCALYGFSQRAEFDFFHDKKELRVGLTIEDGAGQAHSFARRRGNKNTLLSMTDGKPISDGVLSRMLLGAGSSEEFERAFAIGHEELRAGGQAMLDEENASDDATDVSRLLFMAATGLAGIKQIERDFLETAGNLFKPSGSKPPINQGLAELKTLAKRQREFESRSDEYRDLETRLRETRTQHLAFEQELALARQEQSRLTRLQQAFPTLARLRHRRAERVELGEVPSLDEDFAKRRIEIQRAMEVVTGEIDLLETQKIRVTGQLASLVIPEEILASSATIDSLRESLKVHRKAREDSERLRGESAGIERDMRARLQEIGRSADQLDVHADLLQRPDDARIRKLTADRANGSDRLMQARARGKTLRDRLEGIEREFGSLGEEFPLHELRRAIRAAQRTGDIDERIEKLGLELRAARDVAAQSHRDVSMWSGTPEELRMLVVPDEAAIDAFQKRFEKLTRRKDKLIERRSTAETAREQSRHDLATIRRDRDVPDEQTLQAARAQRERAWREIRRDLDGLAPGSDRGALLAETGAHSIIEAYQSAVRTADTIADRLRHEADVVGKVARYQADEERSESELGRLAASEQELESERETLENDWRGLWPFLDAPPRSPNEMRAWSASLRIARERTVTMTRLENDHRQLEKLRAECQADLIEQLASLEGTDPANSEEGTLCDTLLLAERTLDDCQDANLRRAALAKELKEVAAELVEVERGIEDILAQLESANAEWFDWMSTLALPTETSNESAIVVLDALGDVDKLGRDLSKQRERIEEMEADRQEFADDVEALVSAIAPDCARPAFEDALLELHRRLVDARTQTTRREELQTRDSEAVRQIEEKTARLFALQADLRSCCRQACCADADELPTIEANAARAAQLDQQLAELRQDLFDHSGGQSLEEFERELESADVDAIPARLEQLTADIQRLTERDGHVLTEIGKLDQQLAAFGGGADAADIAAEIAVMRARISHQIEQYARARIAARLLREGRERYRRQSGSALLESASQYFSQLTRGAFTGLHGDFDEKDQPTLFGVRAGGGRVEPAGMSDGTRDQLYLALRVAWLHAWLDAHEPLPFVVDDLLIHFDDDRAAAALEVLSELSHRTQVLFFTHHDHLRELARDRVPTEMLHEHELRPASDPRRVLSLARGRAVLD